MTGSYLRDEIKLFCQTPIIRRVNLTRRVVGVLFLMEI
jgi:hypothetical protein